MLIISADLALLQISRSSAIVLLIVFLFYLGYCYHRHVPSPRLGIAGIALAGHAATSVTPTLAQVGFEDDICKLRELCLRDSKKSPKYSIYANGGIMLFSITLTVMTSIYLLHAMEAPEISDGMSKSFVGLVIIPLVFGAAEQIAAAVKSQRESLDWIIEWAIDSSIRITLFVLPATVIVGWAIQVTAMNLFFDEFQVTMLCLVVMLVNYIMHAGSSHW